jgi:hypothetical protein
VRPVVALLALLSFGGIIALMPAWMYFTSNHPALDSVSPETRFLIQLVPVAISMLFLAGWFQPGGSPS